MKKGMKKEMKNKISTKRGISIFIIFMLIFMLFIISIGSVSAELNYTTGDAIYSNFSLFYNSEGVYNNGTTNTLIGTINGTIDDVMIFNTSLNSTQILDIYNNQSARFFGTGTQDIYNQSYMNISTGNNRVNVSTQIQNNLNSKINLTVGYYDGTWKATAPQTITSLTNYPFNISSTSTNLTLNYTFIAGTNQFYSPIIEGDITYEIWNEEEEEEEDTTPPTYSNNQTNNTIAGQSTLFSLLVDDNIALETAGQYIFSTNNTGTWVNESAVNFTATPSWANVTKTLNDTVGISIGWRVYATDNIGNINNTGIFSLITTSADTCTCPGAGNNWEVNMEDMCTLSTPCTLTTGNLSWIGSSGYFICDAQLNLTNRNAPPDNTIFYWNSGCEVIRL